MSSPSFGGRKDHILKKHDSIARRIAESSRKKPKCLNPVSSHLCGHCSQMLSPKVFKKHQKLYIKLGSSVRVFIRMPQFQVSVNSIDQVHNDSMSYINFMLLSD